MQVSNPFILLLCSLLLLSCSHKPTNDGSSTLAQQELKALEHELLKGFEIEDGFKIELFAAEPLVADPVAMEIDEHGHLYVVEMHGYPLDVSRTGLIKRLMDTNGDGLPDSSIVFADQLVLPTGIMRWKSGFIVTDAPDVIYLEDTDQDGKADKREVLLTGFARSNPQHNMNSPVLGLDNWVYLANEYYITTNRFKEALGDKGSPIRSPRFPDVEALPANGGDRSLRFRPEDGKMELLSSRSQYGHTFSPFGHYFQTSNAAHLYQEVIQQAYLNRKPELMVVEAQQYLPDYGKPSPVFAITKNPEHQLLTDVGTITSACGINWYQGGLFPELYDRVIFTMEPVHNLVHASLMTQEGASYMAQRLLERNEFLASEDPWFRPVQSYVGPDGALYILDYYRKVIEHPEWLSDAMSESDVLYKGYRKGRIYRILPENTPSEAWLDNIQLENEADLSKHLASNNIWWRRNAQRLILSQKEKEIPSLTKLMNGDNPLGKLHSMWTLHSLGSLNIKDLSALLVDQHPGIRENAWKIADIYLSDSSKLSNHLLQLEIDPHPRVRFQQLCTLGNLERGTEKASAILQKDLNDPWVQMAALSSDQWDEKNMIEQIIAKADQFDTEHLHSFMRQATTSLYLQKELSQIEELLALALGKNARSINPSIQTGILDGLRQGIRIEGEPIYSLEWPNEWESGIFSMQASVRKALINLLDQLETSKIPGTEHLAKLAIDKLNQESLTKTEDALAFLSCVDADHHLAAFVDYIKPQFQPEIQLAAIQAISRSTDTAVSNILISQWAAMTPPLRDQAVNFLLQDSIRMERLLDAVAEDKIDQATIGWQRSVRLLNNDNDKIRQRARMILENPESDRKALLNDYEETLSLQGSPKTGSIHYQNLCSTCHQLNGKHGQAIGPDLASIRNRTDRSIMADIFMPNRSIADGYDLWVVRSLDGKQYSGIIRSESPNAIQLTDLSGENHLIPRQNIEQLNSQTYSAMPEGLEAALDAQGMADLISFIREGDQGNISR